MPYGHPLSGHASKKRLNWLHLECAFSTPSRATNLPNILSEALACSIKHKALMPHHFVSCLKHCPICSLPQRSALVIPLCTDQVRHGVKLSRRFTSGQVFAAQTRLCFAARPPIVIPACSNLGQVSDCWNQASCSLRTQRGSCINVSFTCLLL